MKTEYRGYTIEPKRDHTPAVGFNVIKDSCNIMPGGCWFDTEREAKRAIDVLIRVKGDPELFWEVMQPFEYTRIGQKSGVESSTVSCGRFKAVIENFRVVKLITKKRDGTITTLESEPVRCAECGREMERESSYLLCVGCAEKSTHNKD
jgi:hypothetical protein